MNNTDNKKDNRSEDLFNKLAEIIRTEQPQLYTITENLEDHFGYEGQPVFKYMTHADGYFTMSDGKGNQWHCGEEEITILELFQRKEEQSTTVPLWRELNVNRTQGQWNIEDEMLLISEGHPVINAGIANFRPWEECKANAEYISLCVNNFSNVVEALEDIVKIFGKEYKYGTIGNAYLEKAKAALSNIS